MKTYYGRQTQQALHNFPFDLPAASLELIYAIVEIKKAAALAHNKTKELPADIADAIVTACDEILSGRFDNQFVTSSLQGGAGTSINMNVNEVIASRASEIANISVHPNDHVNKSQSTNDVNPTALRIVCIRKSESLMAELNTLIRLLKKKAHQYATVQKLARTHMQDAIPMTAGEEIGAWAATLERDLQRIKQFLPYLHEIHLGGTAIGNRLNGSNRYIEVVYPELEQITGFSLKPAKNLMSFTSTTSDFVHLSNLITLLAGDLSKIAHDVRFLASGPRGGIGEYRLQALQPGSSIMPGKVNPVIPETMNHIYYHISGKNLSIQMANETSDLQLAVMFPTAADTLITSLSILTTGIRQFRTLCIETMEVDAIRCRENLEKSTAYATLLTPVLGYDIVSTCVKEAVATGKNLREIILQKNLLSNKKLDEIIE